MDNHHIHTIRLNSVWEPPHSGEAAWLRSFGRPSGIAVDDRVMLVVERPAADAFTLNGVALPRPAAGVARWEHDITSLLRERNLLALEPESGAEAGDDQAVDAHGRAALPRRFGSVALEILTRATIDG